MPEWIQKFVVNKLGVLLRVTQGINGGGDKENLKKVDTDGNHVGEHLNNENGISSAESTILETLGERKRQNERNEKWRTAAAVLDRCLLLVFLLLTILVTIVYFTGCKMEAISERDEQLIINLYMT